MKQSCEQDKEYYRQEPNQSFKIPTDFKTIENNDEHYHPNTVNKMNNLRLLDHGFCWTKNFNWGHKLNHEVQSKYKTVLLW